MKKLMKPSTMDELRARTEAALRGLERRRRATMTCLLDLGFTAQADRLAEAFPPGAPGWIEVWFWAWKSASDSLPAPPHRADMDGAEEALDIEKNPTPFDGAINALLGFHAAIEGFCVDVVAWTGAVTPWVLEQRRTPGKLPPPDRAN
jgi:hypothetical protein